MIDFIKLHINHLPPAHFLSNNRLSHSQLVTLPTGELNYPIISELEGFKIKIKSENFTEISGSLHKYYTGGENYSDFTIDNVKDAVNSLLAELNLTANQILVSNIEFGVNLKVPWSAFEVLDRLIVYKSKPFVPLVSNRTNAGSQAKFQQYEFKIYNKGKQCNLKENVLRIEIRVKKMAFLARNLPSGASKLYLSDIGSEELWQCFQTKLNEAFGYILFEDKTINSLKLPETDKIHYLTGCNPKTWERISKSTERRVAYSENGLLV